jgi:hypothetical protein
MQKVNKGDAESVNQVRCCLSYYSYDNMTWYLKPEKAVKKQHCEPAYFDIDDGHEPAEQSNKIQEIKATNAEPASRVHTPYSLSHYNNANIPQDAKPDYAVKKQHRKAVVVILSHPRL